MEFMLAIINTTAQKPDVSLAEVRDRVKSIGIYMAALQTSMRSDQRYASLHGRVCEKVCVAVRVCLQVVSETYTKTLMQYHGFLVSSAFTVRRILV